METALFKQYEDIRLDNNQREQFENINVRKNSMSQMQPSYFNPNVWRIQFFRTTKL